MARPLQIQIVERARALIADKQHWCRGELARDVSGEGACPTSASAVKRCALGAVIAAAHELTHDLDSANDYMRGHAAVLALFDTVIAAENG
jgi:hypothetical protein